MFYLNLYQIVEYLIKNQEYLYKLNMQLHL